MQVATENINFSSRNLFPLLFIGLFVQVFYGLPSFLLIFGGGGVRLRETVGIFYFPHEQFGCPFFKKQAMTRRPLYSVVFRPLCLRLHVMLPQGSKILPYLSFAKASKLLCFTLSTTTKNKGTQKACKHACMDTHMHAPHKHTHTHIQVHTHTHIQAHTHTHTSTHTHIQAHTHVHIHAHTQAQSHTHRPTHTYRGTHRPTQTQTYTHTSTHKHRHTLTHIHTDPCTHIDPRAHT